MAVGQNQWCHFRVEFTTHFATYFSGDWDVHWGYEIWLLTHGQMAWVLLAPRAPSGAADVGRGPQGRAALRAGGEQGESKKVGSGDAFGEPWCSNGIDEMKTPQEFFFLESRQSLDVLLLLKMRLVDTVVHLGPCTWLLGESVNPKPQVRGCNLRGSHGKRLKIGVGLPKWASRCFSL